MPPNRVHRHRISGLEWVTIVQVCAYFVAITWAFGGNATWLRPQLGCLGSLSGLILLSALLGGENRQAVNMKVLWWVAPIVLFNVLVLVSIKTPGLREMHSGPDILYIPTDVSIWKPVAAMPSDALMPLWLLDASYLTAFNVCLVLLQRRAIRGILIVCMLNAVALAVFGTLQKLVNAPGLFFGKFPTKQPYFFSTFVYHNHWGAFAVLVVAACLALIWRYASRETGRGFLHTPATGAAIALFLLAATEPLSAARACTALTVALLGGAFVHVILRILKQRKELRRGSVLWPVVSLSVVMVAAGVFIFYLGRETILARVALTEQQVSVMRSQGSIGARMTLYRDTWHMARDRPVFGWGMGSYKYMFSIYNSQEPNPQDHIPIYYDEAHNDWLQDLAEYGFVGTILLGLGFVLPVLSLRRSQLKHPFTLYLFSGCAIILLYAWMEFPFGCAAVVFTWWLCFFCATRYAQLSVSTSEE